MGCSCPRATEATAAAAVGGLRIGTPVTRKGKITGSTSYRRGSAAMIFPERDESRGLSRFPIAVVLIITANVIVFLIELALGDSFILRYSMKPAEIVRGEHLETLFTSMFMHANFLHIFGNMLYLWVFGDELDANYLGPIRFTLFYLACGAAAAFLQIAVNPASTEPNLGASGAIAGVLGAFQVVFPRDRILVYIFPFWHVRITALLLTGFWFLLQLENGFGSITSTTQTQGGVAYFAHIGGFIAGMVLVKLFGAGARPAGQQDLEQL